MSGGAPLWTQAVTNTFFLTLEGEHKYWDTHGNHQVLAIVTSTV